MPVGKADLRNTLRLIRGSINEDEREEKSNAICEHLSSITSRDDTVLVYCAKEPEVDTTPYIDYLLSEGIPVIVPLIQTKDISLRLSYITTRSCLKTSTFSVPEPVGKEIPATPEDVTMVILPMLGYDTTGARIGYGAGYYDRFLSENSHMKRVGVAFACQEVSSVPTDPFDIRMHVIITEKGIITCTEET